MVIHRTRHILANSSGFSLIELMVSVGILAFITIIVLANHSRFNSSLLLGNLAYDVALSVREAQVYGLSVRSFGSSFDVGYGVHFAENNSYIFFADVNNDHVYSEDDDSIVKELRFNKGYTVSRFCATSSGGNTVCSNDVIPLQFLDIVFVRPDPDAIMTTNQNGVLYSRATITVLSPGGEERTVEVASTGQISVEPPE